MMEEGKWRLLEEGMPKAKAILDGYPMNAVYSSEEYMKYYDCVYYFCCFRLDYQWKLCDIFKKALEEGIVSKVLPSVMDKDGAPLLTEFLHLWTNYKIMTKCLRGFFQYLDRRTESRTLLSDISFCSYNELVVKVLHKRLTNATCLLITQDRDGVPVDQNLLKGISRFYIEVGEQGNTPYYIMFEEVEQCLLEENRRASEFLYQSSVEKLLHVMPSQMLVQYADKLSTKQNTENMNSMILQDMISRCSSLHLG